GHGTSHGRRAELIDPPLLRQPFASESPKARTRNTVSHFGKEVVGLGRGHEQGRMTFTPCCALHSIPPGRPRRRRRCAPCKMVPVRNHFLLRELRDLHRLSNRRLYGTVRAEARESNQP